MVLPQKKKANKTKKLSKIGEEEGVVVEEDGVDFLEELQLVEDLNQMRKSKSNKL